MSKNESSINEYQGVLGSNNIFEVNNEFLIGGANYGYHHSPAYGVMSSGHSSDSNDMKQSYSNRTNNGSAQVHNDALLDKARLEFRLIFI